MLGELKPNTPRTRKTLDARSEMRPKRFSPSPIKRTATSRINNHPTSVSKIKSFTSNCQTFNASTTPQVNKRPGMPLRNDKENIVPEQARSLQKLTESKPSSLFNKDLKVAG